MIYLIYSSDKEVIQRYIDKLVEKEKIPENSIVKYSSDDDINVVTEECNTLSLFSLKKLVIVDITNILNGKGKDNEELNKYLDNYNKDVILVFTCNLDKVDTKKKLYQKIRNIGKIEALNKDNSYLINLIKENLEDYKMDNIEYFISKVGNNICNINNELDKLKNYKINEKRITKEDIDSLCESDMQEEIFALTDAIVKNDNNRAIKLYNSFLIKNYDVAQMISLLASQFRFLLQVKTLYNQDKSNDEIAKILEVHPYRVKLAIGNCYYYDITSLEDYLLKLFELDKKIKLGLITNKNLFFELFILNKDIK